MVNAHNQHPVADEDRRELLKALGITGTAVASGVTLSEIRDEMTVGSAEELAPIGEAIKADLTGALDVGYLTTHQAAFTDAVSALPVALEHGLPQAEPRNEFTPLVEEGWPIYGHLKEAGFFESTTNHLPRFSPEYLETAVAAFVESEKLANPLEELGFSDGQGVDMLATVIANAEELSTHGTV